MKRFDTGEDVFLRLDENMHRTEALVARIHDGLKNEGKVIPPAQVLLSSSHHRDKKATKMMDAREQIVAASALCQLSQPAPAPLVQATPVLAPTSEELAIRQIVLGTTAMATSSTSVVKL